MNKKIMLLALAVVSAALFAMPAIASAHENHVTGATGKTFKGAGGAGSLVAEGEPTINSVSVGASGEFTSETTGKVTLEFKESAATILGVKLSCHSAGAAAGIIVTTNVYHLITVEEKEPTKGKPAILITGPFPTIICGSGLSERKFQVGGNGVIGTITTPACGASSKSMTLKFAAAGATQEHILYTGTKYDLTNQTEPEGATVTAGINGEATVSFDDGVARTFVCT